MIQQVMKQQLRVTIENCLRIDLPGTRRVEICRKGRSSLMRSVNKVQQLEVGHSSLGKAVMEKLRRIVSLEVKTSG